MRCPSSEHAWHEVRVRVLDLYRDVPQTGLEPQAAAAWPAERLPRLELPAPLLISLVEQWRGPAYSPAEGMGAPGVSEVGEGGESGEGEGGEGGETAARSAPPNSSAAAASSVAFSDDSAARSCVASLSQGTSSSSSRSACSRMSLATCNRV